MSEAAAETPDRSLLGLLGGRVLNTAESMGQFTMLVRSSLFWFLRSAVEWRQTMIQIVHIGVQSAPVSILTSLFTGMVLALETGSSFINLFNEPVFTGTIVAFAIAKELGPVMTAVVVAGRAGAAIAAELGTMKVTEQIDALYTLGTDPIRYLVIPRVIAFFIVLPILTIFSDFAGIFGGGVVGYFKLGIPPNIYWHEVVDHLDMEAFFHGLVKTFFFAFCIAFISCYKGIFTRGGAEGVGRSTTEAVVYSMVSVLVLDYFVTAVLVAIGIT
ncbi:MAG: ABC transporter permease [Elusimicrobia bacterium]|nr:ABC transporter permease [Elusimicrobiota bacterium]